ncbi:amino acid ABC transporter permease [Paraburkholderia rhynchosiae]|uniref:Amino acid ABC transporter permease n=1 Tax=Paraburkholderia rhynchosiae TaxID=487049 RepID=A0A2N7WH81_9BURK|nr:amino acid ABC transporter permease [Paraburkholderia rhynchosiae]PMS28829.1 amino acid ABC transporter permease [Paraburkholderia rhynchosiae]CAB3655710.1 L-cystine transport system permease protein YecS [Paraburkholderia rhynchosiae]
MQDTILAIIEGVPWTVALTAITFLLGAILGLPLCAMRLSKFYVIRAVATWIVVICRSIPPIVWLFFVFFGIGNDIISMSPFVAAALGLGIVTAANMSEVYRGALTAIHPGQFEAARVLNLNRAQQFRDVVFPQLIRIALPTAATYLIGLLKDSAVASTIGVSELAFQAYHVSQQTFQGLSVYGAAALLYIALSLPIAWLSRWADLRLRSRVSR